MLLLYLPQPEYLFLIYKTVGISTFVDKDFVQFIFIYLVLILINNALGFQISISLKETE